MTIFGVEITRTNRAFDRFVNVFPTEILDQPRGDVFTVYSVHNPGKSR